METLKKKYLFWEADTQTLDPNKNEKFIINRILYLGDADDFKWAMEYYGPAKIKKGVLQGRSLDRKSFSFWCQYFNIDKSKCIFRQLTRKQSAFWKRSPPAE